MLPPLLYYYSDNIIIIIIAIIFLFYFHHKLLENLLLLRLSQLNSLVPELKHLYLPTDLSSSLTFLLSTVYFLVPILFLPPFAKLIYSILILFGQ